MNIDVLENKKNKIKLEFKGEDAYLPHLFATECWEKNGEATARREHPFLAEPKLIVKGTNPGKILKRAAKSIAGKCDELSIEFKKTVK